MIDLQISVAGNFLDEVIKQNFLKLPQTVKKLKIWCFNAEFVFELLINYPIIEEIEMEIFNELFTLNLREKLKKENLSFEKLEKFVCRLKNWEKTYNMNLFIWFASRKTVKFLELTMLEVDKNADESLNLLKLIDTLQIETLHLIGIYIKETEPFIGEFFKKLDNLSELIIDRFTIAEIATSWPKFSKLRKITFLDLPDSFDFSVIFDKLQQYSQLLSIRIQTFRRRWDEIYAIFKEKKFNHYTTLSFED